MTTYSIFAENFPDEWEDVVWAKEQSVLHGAGRALLDLVEMDGAPDERVFAEDFHTPRAGWELRAFMPADGEALAAMVHRVVRDRSAEVDAVAALIKADPSQPDYVAAYHGGEYYRLGYLYVCTLRGEGMGLWEFGAPGMALSDWIGRDESLSAVAYPGGPYVDLMIHTCRGSDLVEVGGSDCRVLCKIFRCNVCAGHMVGHSKTYGCTHPDAC